MKFRKKPVVIEAVQFTGSNCFDVLRFMGRTEDIYTADLNQSDIPIIYTLEGDMTCSAGDWIIKGVKGEFYPCKDDIFRLTYELAEVTGSKK